MSADLEAMAKRFNDEVFTQGKFEVIDELVAADYVEHQEFPGLEPTREGLEKFVQLFHAAFSDINVETLSVGVDGDELWVHSIFTGTHTGEFMGIPASGNQLDLELADMVRVRDGQIVEHWGVSDSLAMMQQLGAAPPPPG